MGEILVVLGGIGALAAGLFGLRKLIVGLRVPRPLGRTWPSLRIGTFNTHLDSLIFDIAHATDEFILKGPDTFIENHKEKIKAQAEAIATQILTGGFDHDVIALIEVFDELARAVLIERLSGVYPYYVSRLPEVDAPIPNFMLRKYSELLSLAVSLVEEIFGTVTLMRKEDSGLMLFSRFPIEEVRFAPFTFKNESEMLAAFPDSCAEKGAAYVRIRDSRSGGGRYHFVLAHLQENKEEWAWVRVAQLHQIRELIESMKSVIGGDDLFVMGDLNIDGIWTNVDLPPKPKTIEDIEPAPGSPEWKKHFGDPAGFFGSAVRDTWFHDTSRRDTGATSLGGGRIDYILHNDAAVLSPRDLCIQHLTVTERFNEAGAFLSDHRGINADLNRAAPHCHPRDAIVLSKFDESIAGTLRNPGSMVWYRIDQPGTYSLAIVGGSDVSVDLYQSIDLSHPIRQYKGETTTIRDERTGHPVTGRTFQLPDAPYYVRVFHQNRSKAMDYALLVHKHKGTDANDAIALAPYELRGELFPFGKPVNADDTLWFTLDTEKADSGKAQDLSFHLSGFPGTVTHFEVRASDEKTVLAGAATTAGEELIVPLKDIGPSKMYLLIRREDPAFAGALVLIEWRTNLTILHGSTIGGASNDLTLICNNETNPEFGADDIILRLWVDGELRISAFVGEFEEGDPASLQTYVPAEGFHYLENIGVLLVEEDSVSPDDESDFTIPILRAHRESPKDEIVHEFEGGRYILQFNRSFQVHPPPK